MALDVLYRKMHRADVFLDALTIPEFVRERTFRSRSYNQGYPKRHSFKSDGKHKDQMLNELTIFVIVKSAQIACSIVPLYVFYLHVTGTISPLGGISERRLESNCP